LCRAVGATINNCRICKTGLLYIEHCESLPLLRGQLPLIGRILSSIRPSRKTSSQSGQERFHLQARPLICTALLAGCASVPFRGPVREMMYMWSQCSYSPCFHRACSCDGYVTTCANSVPSEVVGWLYQHVLYHRQSISAVMLHQTSGHARRHRYPRCTLDCAMAGRMGLLVPNQEGDMLDVKPNRPAL